MPEPRFETGMRPELSLQQAMYSQVARFLQHQRDLTYVLLEGYGLDISVFLTDGNTNWFRQIELKAYSEGRPGSVGFGNYKGRGPQVDLFWDKDLDRPRSDQQLTLLDRSICWVLAYVPKPMGSARYAFFSCSDAKQAAMGGVKPDKQNNLRVRDFEQQLLNWNDLLRRTGEFLL